MRAKWLCLVALAAAAAGCGQGRAIFDIDVFSFLSATNADTLAYRGPLPPLVPDTIPVQTVKSLGIGSSSLVDTVRLIGSVNFVNDSGTGNVTFAVYFDTVKSAVYTGTPAFSVSGAVTPGVTTPSPFDIPDLPTALKPLFLASTVYVGIRVSATPTPPSGPVRGTAKLTALRARIVIQDKLF
jgi:hypothetical protein